jgi:hypothetical protein
VPGSVLRLLQDGGRAARFYHGHDLLGLMAHNDEGLFGAQGSTRPKHLLDQGAATCAVEHLRKAGLQPGAFSGGKDNDSKFFRSHGVSSFWGSEEAFAKY